ncbi:MAG: hypothetical protein CMJ78_27680 [Planctomycetaceae bacterium]|nr:hypothetical protein [Planctomycetaceae bacterium]
MAELIAIGQNEGQRWRQTLPDDTQIRLGRSPQSGWMVPWDSRISRHHCDLLWQNGVLLVKCLETASNPTFFRGRPSREFCVRPGEEFRIARTRFEVAESDPVQPISDDSTQMSAARTLLDNEIAAAAWGLTAILDIGNTAEFEPLRSAIQSQIDANIDQAFLLLTCFLSSKRNSFSGVRFSTARQEQRELMVTRMSQDLPDEARGQAMPLLVWNSPHEMLAALSKDSPKLVPLSLSRNRRINEILSNDPPKCVTPWIQSSALFCIALAASEDFTKSIVSMLQSPNAVVRETAICALASQPPDVFLKHIGVVANDKDDRVISALNRYRSSSGRESKPLLTIEKVRMLKSVSIFSETADHVLAAIGPLLEETRIQPGETLFEKGDLGNCMYVIRSGRVRVHDGDKTIRELTESDIFGEMSVLDPLPRSASVTAMEESLLYHLDQETLLELMAERTEVLSGVVRVLCQRLRA